MPRERLRSIMRPRHKLEQRAEAPDTRRAENVQARNRGLETFLEDRKSLKYLEGFPDLRCKEAVLGNIRPVPGAEEDVIDGSFRAIVQAHPDPIPGNVCQRDRTTEAAGHVTKSIDQPT